MVLNSFSVGGVKIMVKNLVLINGEIVEGEKGKVSLSDRGYQFGDGVFEVVPVYNGRSFALCHIWKIFSTLLFL
jgi:D-alanine transaminase